MNNYRLPLSLLKSHRVAVVARWTTEPSGRRLLSDGTSSSSSKSGRTETTVTGSTITADGKKVINMPLYLTQFTVLFIPAVALGIYMISFGPDEEQINERVRAKYGDNLQIQQKNAGLKEFFLNVEQGSEDGRLQQVLNGGKGEKKRFHAVDPELYGTEQGLVVKQQVTEELEQSMEERKRRRKEQRRLMKQKKSAPDAVATTDSTPSTTPTTARSFWYTPTIDQETIQTAAVYSLIGTVAIVIGFFAGSRRQS